jgi:hypothetical protein
MIRLVSSWKANTSIVSLLALGIASIQLARADTLFWTDIGANQIIQTVTPSTNTLVANTAPFPDSLIFNSTGSAIIYTSLQGPTAGVWEVNTDGTGNRQLATQAQLGGSDFVQDLALDLSGTSVLVTTTDTGDLYRVSLTGGSVTLLASLGSGLRGIAYDTSGDLFAQVTFGKIVQLNPTTGAVINSRSTGGADGLTFDPMTGALWAGTGNTLEEISTDLTTLTTFSCPICSGIDGVESDGNGHIDLAETGGEVGQVVQFTIAGGTFAKLATTDGIDDLAPLTGGGAPPTVPEPATTIPVGVAIAILGFVQYRRKRNQSAGQEL